MCQALLGTDTHRRASRCSSRPHGAYRFEQKQSNHPLIKRIVTRCIKCYVRKQCAGRESIYQRESILGAVGSILEGFSEEVTCEPRLEGWLQVGQDKINSKQQWSLRFQRGLWFV